MTSKFDGDLKILFNNDGLRPRGLGLRPRGLGLRPSRSRGLGLRPSRSDSLINQMSLRH